MGESVAVIGVGAMGEPMARRLLDGGLEVAVFDIREERAPTGGRLPPFVHTDDEPPRDARRRRLGIRGRVAATDAKRPSLLSDGLFGRIVRKGYVRSRCITLQRTWQRPTLPRLKTKYHRRWGVSRPCSEWERVWPRRHSHQVGKAQDLPLAGANRMRSW